MKKQALRSVVYFSLAAFAFSGVRSAWAQPGSDGIDWVTVGAVGNRAYDGPDPFSRVTGRGSVGYEYKMGRTEVTTEQWLGFFNAALARPDPLPFASTIWWGTPVIWGATRDTSYTGPGVRYRLRTDVANAGMLPVSGITWRQAALLCNWLHNERGTTPSAFINGAYDVSTFTPEVAFPTFNDQAAHAPGARYWIPTLDEYMKAVHFDPNANGGAGRWWQQPNGSDTPLIYAPPPSFGGDGTGQANAGFRLPGAAQYRIPLGAYPDVRSPFGVLDAAGGTAEWLEDIRTVDTMQRLTEGSSWGSTARIGADVAWGYGTDYVHLLDTAQGFRLASNIPEPSSALVLTVLGGMCVRRSRKRDARDEALPDRVMGVGTCCHE